MLWFLVALLLAMWAGGLFLDVAGGFIHALLVLAVVVAVANLFRGVGRGAL